MSKRKRGTRCWADKERKKAGDLHTAVRTTALRNGLEMDAFQRECDDLINSTPHKNLVICVPGIGTRTDFAPYISDRVTDLGLLGATQCFPLHYYVKDDKPKTQGHRSLFDAIGGAE